MSFWHFDFHSLESIIIQVLSKKKKEANNVEIKDSKKPKNEKRPVPSTIISPEEPPRKRASTGRFISARPRSASPQPQNRSFSPPLFNRPRSASPPSFYTQAQTPRSSRSRPGSLSPVATPVSSKPSAPPLRDTRSSSNLLPTTSGGASLFGEECILCGNLRFGNTSEVTEQIGVQKDKSGDESFRNDLKNSIDQTYVQIHHQL